MNEEVIKLMQEIPKIIEVRPLNDLVLLVRFDNNVTKKYDVKPLLSRYPVFQNLKNPESFKQVAVSGGGYGIVWNEEIDLSEYEIWNNGIEVSPMRLISLRDH